MMLMRRLRRRQQNTKPEPEYDDYEQDSKKGLCLKNKKGSGFLFLLSIPKIRKSLAMIGQYCKESEVCIEYLFPDNKIKDLLKDKPQVGGGKVQVKDTVKKSNFAESTKDFTEEDFKNFIPIFDLIKKIIDSKNFP